MLRQGRAAFPRTLLLVAVVVNLVLVRLMYVWITAQPSQQHLPSLAVKSTDARRSGGGGGDEAVDETGSSDMGKHFRVRPSPPSSAVAKSRSARIETCEYPVVVHITPNEYCTGALGVYASVVRNVQSQPERLRGKTCAVFAYVDHNLTSLEAMYRWEARPNPYSHVPDCAALDAHAKLGAEVPVRFVAVAPIQQPDFIKTEPRWATALSKLHSTGIDIYPRILTVDADSMLLTDLDRMFLETPPGVAISASSDQFGNCHDRKRMNSGLTLLRPSRYLHITTLEMLYDQGAPCLNDNNWAQADQEVLTCMCGYTYQTYSPFYPEFQCNIMPMYFSVWPRNYGCSSANVLPARSIHFAACKKPWELDDAALDARPDTRFWKCLRDGARAGSATRIRDCQPLTLADTRDLPNLD